MGGKIVLAAMVAVVIGVVALLLWPRTPASVRVRMSGAAFVAQLGLRVDSARAGGSPAPGASYAGTVASTRELEGFGLRAVKVGDRARVTVQPGGRITVLLAPAGNASLVPVLTLAYDSTGRLRAP